MEYIYSVYTRMCMCINMIESLTHSGETEGVVSSYQWQGVSGPPETVNLLVGVTDEYLRTRCLPDDVDNGGREILSLINHQDVPSLVISKVRGKQLEQFKIA